MKTKTKTVFVLMGILLIGMVVGFFGHGIFIKHHRESRVNDFRTPEGFLHRFERAIQPTDEQRVEMKKILKKHFTEMMTQRQMIRTKMNSLHAELETVLTEEQRERLEKHFKMRKHHPEGPRFRGRKGKGKGKKGKGRFSPEPPPPRMGPDSLLSE